MALRGGGPSYSTYVPSDELERPQRDALQRALEAMTPPGLAQQGTMLRERFDALGPVRAAERTADDLAGLFGRLGPISPLDVLNPARLGARAGAAAGRAVAESEAGVEAELRAGETLARAGPAATQVRERLGRVGAELLPRVVPDERQPGGERVELGGITRLLPLPPALEGLRPGAEGYVEDLATAGRYVAQRPGEVAAAVDTAAGFMPGRFLTRTLPRVVRGEGRQVLGELGQALPALGAAGTLVPLPAVQAGNLVANVVEEPLLRQGVNPAVAGAAGLAADVLTPSPGDLPRIGARAPRVAADLTGLARRGLDRFGQAAAEEAAADAAAGVRRGQHIRIPPLTPEQQVQRAADGAAEQRVFDAIRALWRRGPAGEEIADELRFLSVGKGEAGEAAARELLASRGLEDVLPPPTAAGVLPGSPGSTTTGEGVLGLARRATEPLGAGAARTPGERAFDVATGTAGGVVGAATAEEDATWQERVGRGALGASLGALGGANLRQLGRVARGALADEALGAVPLSPRGNARDAAGEAIQQRAARERHLANIEARAAGVAPEAGQPGGATEAATGAVGATARVQPQEQLRRILLPGEREALRRAIASGREPPPEAAAALRRVTGAGGDEADAVVGELLEALPARPADPAQAGNWDRLLAFITSNLLSNPRSLLGNAMGGVEQGLGRVATRIGERGPVGGARDVWTELKASWAAKGDILRAARNQFVTGERPAAVREALQEATDQTPEAFAGKRGMLATPALRAAGATDAFFALSARAGAEAVADARGLTGLAREAFIRAQVKQSVLSAAPSSVAKLIGDSRRLLTSPTSTPLDRLKGAALFAYVPVMRIPETIWRQGVRRAVSPVLDLPGAAKDVVNLARGRPQDVGPALRRWTTNSTVAGLAAWQVGDGSLTGSGPQDPDERKRWEAQGWRPNSFRVGDDWYSYEFLGPLATQLNLVATFAETLHGRGSPPTRTELEKYTEAFNRVGAVVVDEHPLRNLFRMVDSIGQGRLSDVLAQGALELGGRLVPVSGALNWGAQGVDPLERQAQTPLERQAARTPARGLLEPVIDPTTGAPLQRGGTALERLGGFGRILPAGTEVRAELARLGVTAREFKPQDTVYGNVQTPAARRVLQETYGRLAGQYLRDAMARPDYKGATDEVQAATLERQLGLAQKLADLEVGDKVARDPQARYELEWLRTPHYQGVKGAPDAVARRNLEISEAKQLLSEYRGRYGTGAGTDRLYREDRAALELAMTPEIPAEYLAEQQAKLRQRLGAPDTRDRALPGAGNRVLAAASAPFVAPGGEGQPAWVLARERQKEAQRRLEREDLISGSSGRPTGGGGFRSPSFVAP